MTSIVTEAGAEDFTVEEEGFHIYTAPEMLNNVLEGIKKAGILIEESSFEMVPKITVACSEEDAQANMKLIDWLFLKKMKVN